MTQRFYLTTPIFYVNGAPHIGHAYTTVAADVLARWKRLDGYDVMFLTGTDEHGLKVEQAAGAAGLPPQDWVDRVAEDFRAMGHLMGGSFDQFIRTSEPRHKAACAALWQALAANDAISLGAYEGWYSVRDETYYAEEELQIDAAGQKRAPTGAPVAWVSEPSYFFKMSAWQQKLLDFYEAHPDFIGPAGKRNEVVSFVRGGLNDLSISRTSFTWGVPVPGDPSHVMYVWLDALTNYLTAVGYPNENAADWVYWPADLHLVGKDILRFHAVIWPAILMAAGLPLPKRIFSHGWWTADGEKMSKSLGNVIDPKALVAEFGLDAIRFFLLREVPFGNDGAFSRRALISRLNTELANDLGNLAQRSLSLIARNCAGRLPEIGPSTDEDAAMREAADALPGLMRAQLDRQAYHEALEEVWKVIRAANGYIDRQAPWALRKTDISRMETVLRVLVDTIRVVATVLQPFMPTSMSTMLDQLAVPPTERQLTSLQTRLVAGTVLPAPVGVFPRFVQEET
jgi:methionyl-tRNA synthetase